MKHWPFIITILCLAYHTSVGQKAEWSEEEKIIGHNVYARILGQNKEGLYVLRQTETMPSHNITIERYGENLHKAVTEQFLIKKGEFLVQASLQENELQVFYGVPNKETQNIDVWVKRLDANMVETGKDTLIFSLPATNIRYEFLTVYKPNRLPITICIYPNDNYTNPASLHYILLNSDLSLYASGDFSVNMESSYTISQLEFTKEEIVMVADMGATRKDENITEHFLLSGSFGVGSLQKTPLFDDSTVIGEGILKGDYKNNTLVYAGLYKMQDSGYSKGCYVWMRDIGGNKLNTYKIPFPAKLVEDMTGKSAKVKGVYNLVANGLSLRQDGGLILTAEEQETSREMVNEVNTFGISQANYRMYFYYKSLVALSINKDGKIDWYKALRKEQQTIDDNGIYSSYITAAMPGKLVYAYNDLSRKNWSLAGFEVQPDGTAQNEVLIKTEDYNAELIPAEAVQVAENQIVIPGFGRKGAVLMRLSF